MTVVAIVGPTAAGKSSLSLALAEQLGAEIVNADSMQLYRGMDIGTAKLMPGDRRGIRHHVLDIWDVRETASVAEYQRMARAAIDDIYARGLVPMLVGGSGLYIRAVLEHFEFPGTDPELRERLEAELSAVGPRAMHTRLAALDPAAAGKILPSNGRRIVRAIEVIELTGGPFTAVLPEPRPAYPSVQIGVDLDSTKLDDRIAVRVRYMWDAGLVDEVRALAAHGLREGRTASRALGYQQILAYLDGSCSLEQASADTTQATRRFVRRQRTWFHRDPRIRWLDATAPDLVPAALGMIEQATVADTGGS